MRFQQASGVAFFIGMVASFSYGAIAVKFDIFPIDQIRSVKQLIDPNAQPNAEHSNYYYDKVSFLEQHGQEADIVMIGDSITDAAEWDYLFPGLAITNHGIEGDKTDGVIDRLDSIYATKASRAFIMIGFNDFNSGAEVDAVFANYEYIISQLVSRGIKPYIQSTLLAGQKKQALNPKIIELNHRLKQLAELDENVTFIDLNVGLSRNNLLNPEYSRDSIHLNGKGYTVWRDIIEPYMMQESFSKDAPLQSWMDDTTPLPQPSMRRAISQRDYR